MNPRSQKERRAAFHAKTCSNPSKVLTMKPNLKRNAYFLAPRSTPPPPPLQQQAHGPPARGIPTKKYSITFGRASPRRVKVRVGSSTISLMVSRIEFAMVVTRKTLMTCNDEQGKVET